MTGRTVMISGADSGIGAACAKAFGKQGDKVVVLYHTDVGGAEATASAVKRGGGKALVLQCSVDEAESVEAAYQEVEARFGPVSILVNSAGINMANAHVREMRIETWNDRIATDLTGAFLMSRRFLSGRGESTDLASIVHISSIHAQVVRAGGSAYCAAKGGLTKLVQTLAVEEAARGIRINAIEPGMILTPMNQKALDDADYRKSLEKNIPMQRAGKPEEVADLAVWLSSDQASYITGATITIDGGLSLLLGIGA